MKPLLSSGNKLVKWGLNLILPPRCPISGDIVDSVGAISPRAWRDLTFISDPKCKCCCIPFAVDVATGIENIPDYLCADCMANPKPFDRTISLLQYDDASKKLVLAFKHGDALHLHTSITPLLANAGQEILSPDSILVPVPLHWRRLVKRRYNQSAVLCASLSKHLGLTYYPDALTRTRHTPPQGHRSARERHKNVAGAFDIKPSTAQQISGKTIILVDDVYTTGATLEECAKVLKAAGAKAVNILTVARAVKQ